MSRNDPDGILYLSAADVRACAVTPAEVTAAVEAAFREAARGTAETRATLAIPAGDLASFRAKGGVLREAAYGAVKWYGYFPNNLQAGLPEYRPLIILNEARSGFAVAIMSGDWITAHRTAAISAVGAKWLARPESSHVGFIGCGAQARANLEALLPLFPITSAIGYSRRIETAETFAAFCRERGIAAEATTDPRRAVSEADIVITSVPRLSTTTPFLEVNWVAPGAFVSMVDSGRSWKPEQLERFTRRITDEMQEGLANANEGDDVRFDAALMDVVGRPHAGRASPDDLIALLFHGTGLADVAAATLVYERARMLGLGQVLPA